MRIILKELRNLVRSEVRKKHLRENVEQTKQEFITWLTNQWNAFVKAHRDFGWDYLVKDFFKEKLEEFANLKNLSLNFDIDDDLINVETKQEEPDEYGTPGNIEGRIYVNGEYVGSYDSDGEGARFSGGLDNIDDFWPFQDVTSELQENSTKISLKELRSLVRTEVRKKHLRENTHKISLKELRSLVKNEVRKSLRENVDMNVQKLNNELQKIIQKEVNNGYDTAANVTEKLNKKIQELAWVFSDDAFKPFYIKDYGGDTDEEVFFSEYDGDDSGNIYVKLNGRYSAPSTVGEFSHGENNSNFKANLKYLPKDFWPYLPYGDKMGSMPNEDSDPYRYTDEETS